MNLSGDVQFDGGTAANASVSIPGSIVGGENGMLKAALPNDEKATSRTMFVYHICLLVL